MPESPSVIRVAAALGPGCSSVEIHNATVSIARHLSDRHPVHCIDRDFYPGVFSTVELY